ncbi:methyl-accepting chemotaxis protein [Mameliella alba]|nr:methyl-accepting chemotaxis protein [Mameliella alba]MBY6169683.1 methyl-accepting chemotaxis protein [Mameliella alba]MBY6174702.1 methyl-accepting chemotaxis protein [Mameliella alba]
MQHPQNLTTPDQTQELAQLTEAASGLGRETVDIGGFLQDLDNQCRQQLSELSDAGQQTATLAEVSARMLQAVDQMAGTADETLGRVQSSVRMIGESGQNSQILAEWVRSVHAGSAEVEEMLNAVQSSNTLISDIAWQVHILAVNAKIEAARAGQAGKGFAIVAESVKDLSQKTADAAQKIDETVARLSEWMSRLHNEARTTAQQADSVLSQAGETDHALADIQQGIGTLRDGAQGLSTEAEQARAAVDSTRAGVDRISASVTKVAAGVDEASRRCFSLIDTSEEILQHAVALGGNGADGAMITLVQDLAGQVAQAMTRALDKGRITEGDLFARQYRPIPGTDPEQVLAPFTRLTDEILPPIQDPVLQQDARIVFCAAVDQNGYLPTHNRQFSHPQGQDPVWNAAHCRNRRMFDDRVGLKAGRSTKPFLLQVYRRDMGGETFVMMKDLSAPITVRGRHWGGLRLAYKF